MHRSHQRPKSRQPHAWQFLALGAGLCLLFSAWPSGSATKSLPAVSPIRFRNRAQAAGLDFVLENSPTTQKHLIETMPGGIAVFDYNGDGLPDIYFTNGAAIPSLEKNSPRYFNRLFRNDGGWEFTDGTEQAGVSGSGYSMGAAAADYDNDGHVDLFVTGVFKNTLYHNLGNGQFEDASYSSRLSILSAPYSGWAEGFFDFNNDGWKDIFSANAHVDDNIAMFQATQYKQPNSIFANLGDGTFTDATPGAGPDFQQPNAHRGAAFADFNRDGKMDAVVSSLGAPAELWENISPNENHWIVIRPIGTKSNRDGIGTRIRIGNQVNQMTSAVGYASSSHFGVHFGLGKMAKIDEIELRWPSGISQVLHDIQADQYLEVREPAK